MADDRKCSDGQEGKAFKQNPAYFSAFSQVAFETVRGSSASWQKLLASQPPVLAEGLPFAVSGSGFPAKSGPSFHRCHRCGKGYSFATGLSRHRKQCYGVYNIQCNQCGKRFHRSDHLNRHRQRKHGPCRKHDTN
ncbi:hypothetical protein ACOMHN_036007 [Nucella lapillus]